MDTRQIRGLEIAATSNVTHNGHLWLIPSQRTNKKYTVDFNENEASCTCPDYEGTGLKCKHIFAVEYVRQRERGLQLPAPPKIEKPTYKQEWTAYNQAQTNEKSLFMSLLHDLCQNIHEPPQTMGRPRASVADLIFAACMKVYSGMSGRRNQTDMRETLQRGYLSRPLHYNTISKYLEREDLTPYLKALITESSLPLKAIEVDFAIDSSGFSTGVYQKWVDAKWGKLHAEYGDKDTISRISKKDWVKCHVMCGVKTNIITSVEISHAHAGDSPYFSPLVEATSSNFVMNEVSADMAYSSGKNLKLVLAKGAMPYIPFKSTSKGIDTNAGAVWKRMYHFFKYNQEWFLSHYHKRSNVETVFSMMKRKFGERLKSKTRTAQANEVLCKVLCHNLCCVIQSMYELGIEADFSVA